MTTVYAAHAADVPISDNVARTSEVVRDRGEVYGPPAEHFARTVAILAVVFGDTRVCDLEPWDWPLVMICDKLARLGGTRDHVDSVRDIAGYAETWFMARGVDTNTRLP